MFFFIYLFDVICLKLCARLANIFFLCLFACSIPSCSVFYSVKQRCLAEQKRRKQRATKKISIFIGSFIICFAPYVITR